MTTQAPPMTASRWLILRLLPCVLLVAAGTAIAGLFRTYMLFLPGIMGMIAGGVLGWATGRIGRGDPEDVWAFGHRVWLALGAGILFSVGAAAVISVLHVGALGLPLDWLSEVVAGHEGELFAGTSTNSFQSVEGTITGAWWLVFVFVDGLLFSFLFLVTTVIGWRPDDDVGEQEEDPLRAPPPLAPPGIGPPLSLMSFGLFLFVSLAVIGGLAAWPYLTGPSEAELAESTLMSELQGDWVFGEEATFLGHTVEERSFTFSRGLGTELAGFSKISPHFMLSLEMRRDGLFEGRLHVRMRDTLSVRMQPSEDRNSLVLFVDTYSPAGWIEKRLTAHRVDGEP